MSDKGKQYTDENAADDFNAGFTKPDETQPAVVKSEGEGDEEIADDKSEGEEKTEGVEGADSKDTPEDKPEETVTVTKSQLERLLAAADKVDGVDDQIRKLFGTTGDLKNLVKNLQDSTPKGAKVEIPADAFKEMEEEYPEIAAHMRKSLEKALSGTKGTGDDKPAGTVDDKTTKVVKPEEVEAIVDNAVTRREMASLAEDHPNWRADVGAVDAEGKFDPKHPFRVWLNSQPVEYRKRINDTDSPLVISRALDKYKTFSAAEKAKKPSTPPKNDKSAKARNERIEDAVTQRGDGAPPKSRKTADEEFSEGFKTG